MRLRSQVTSISSSGFAHGVIDWFVVQGMNFVAALMLLIVKDEERVFWLMDTLLNEILPGQSSSVCFVFYADGSEIPV